MVNNVQDMSQHGKYGMFRENEGWSIENGFARRLDANNERHGIRPLGDLRRLEVHIPDLV